MTLWVDTLSGERLDRNALAAVQERARRTYETNPHIFEDALDAFDGVRRRRPPPGRRPRPPCCRQTVRP